MENLAAYLAILVDEINDRTPWDLRVQPWAYHRGMQSRLRVKKRQGAEAGVVRQIQWHALERGRVVEALGITDLREVPELLLTDAQAWVRAVTISGETSFDAAGAAAELAPHGFPAWFLDFETVMMPVPIWKGTRPYQQIPFQFSLHRIDEDGTLHHEAFLDLGGEDPSGRLARELVGKVGPLGPVYAYHASFERTVIHALARRFPDLAGPLVALAERLVDLKPVAKDHFYHSSQHGSWSLKAVLPAACPDLSYDTLDGVADGGMAMDAYR